MKQDAAIKGANHGHNAMVVPPCGHDAIHANFHGSHAMMGDVVTHFASNSATDA